MKKPRCIAICYVQDGSRIFVGDGYDPKKKRKFYRPLGGSIEWRETSYQAVIREFKEEMNSELVNLRFETVIENIFTYDGEWGHEVVMLFSADFADRTNYEKESIPCIEDDGLKFNGVWLDLDHLDPEVDLYPDGLFEYIRGANNSLQETPSDAPRPS